MRADEVINEGPIDAARNKLADVNRGRQAKKLQKRREAALKKFAPEVRKLLIRRVDELLIDARSKQRSVSRNEFKTLIYQFFNQILKLDVETYPEITNSIDALVSTISRDPETQLRSAGVSKQVAKILSQGLQEKTPGEKSSKNSNRRERPEVVIISGQAVELPADNRLVYFINTKIWLHFKKTTRGTLERKERIEDKKFIAELNKLRDEILKTQNKAQYLEIDRDANGDITTVREE